MGTTAALEPRPIIFRGVAVIDIYATTWFRRSSFVYVFIFFSDIHANAGSLMRPVYLSPEAAKLMVTF
jgi:hypothetical protein